MNVDVVLWDFGGVFTSSPFVGIEVYAAELGLPAAQLRDLVFGPYHADTDHPWHRLERGEVTVAEAVTAIQDQAAAAGVAFDSGALFSRMGGADGPARGARSMRTLQACAERGVRHALVTNNIAEFADGWKRMLDISAFEHIVDSSAIGIRKPDPGIFLLALERMGADAGRTVFVDDVESNVEAARALGMAGVVAGDDIEAAMDELERLVGL